MNKIILALLVTSSFTVAQEVSVFGAGNLDSKNPYGLNSSEKHILKNQKNINNLSSKVTDLNSLIDSLNKRLEGLESIYEGDSSKLNETVLRMNELMKKVDLSTDLASKNQEETNEIKSVSEQLLNMKAETDKEVRASIATLKRAISKITKLVNKINSEYVSSEELKKNMSQFVTREEFEELKKNIGATTKKVSVNVSTSSNNTSAATSSTDLDDDLSTSAKRSAYMEKAKEEYSRRYFTGAIPKFEKLAQINYKPAESNYYLGEMWFVRKKYEKAISYFKQSAILYDKADWMPTLLLHSAISFEKLNDKENAKSFYATLVDLYPSSSEAKIAKKNLKNL
jgi:TolA-binding protein